MRTHSFGDDCPGGHYDQQWTRETVPDAAEVARSDADATTNTQDDSRSPAQPVEDGHHG